MTGRKDTHSHLASRLPCCVRHDPSLCRCAARPHARVQELELEQFQQRQRFLQELEALKGRELEMQRQLQARQHDLDVQAERIREREQVGSAAAGPACERGRQREGHRPVEGWRLRLWEGGHSDWIIGKR